MRKNGDWFTAKVTAVRDVAPDIRELTFRADSPTPAYPPGAHVDVRVRTAAGPELRSYSLIGTPVDGGLRIAVKQARDTRGGSRFMWSLQPGSTFPVSSPLSSFELRDAPQSLLVAGGIGVTPIIGMASDLARRGADYSVAYAGGSLAGMAYADQLLAEHGPRLSLHATASGQRIDFDDIFAQLRPDAVTYVCGPMRMLDAARQAWTRAGRPISHLRFETFGSSGHFPAEAFVVHVPRLGRDVTVAAHVSMLDALEEAGVGVLADCRRGECGLCVMEVLGCDGEIDHRDVFLSDHQHDEARKICTCVSRVVGGSITIDTAYRGDQKLGV